MTPGMNFSSLLLFGGMEATSRPCRDLVGASRQRGVPCFPPSETFQSLKDVLMHFEDIAIHFTEEEWALLDEGKRALHQEVMEENIATLIPLAANGIPLPLSSSGYQMAGAGEQLLLKGVGPGLRH
nr:zinc finger protein 596-like [Pogona vitticeps]